MNLEFREEMKIFRRLWSTDISERPSSEVLSSLQWKLMSAKKGTMNLWGQTGEIFRAKRKSASLPSFPGLSVRGFRPREGCPGRGLS